MNLKLVLFYFLNCCFCLSANQVLQFGLCPEVEPMLYFDIEKFLGKWYEIERFPTFYEEYGNCAYKNILYCGKKRIEIEHGYVKNEIKYILHVNSSYSSGDVAVFSFDKNNIDPMAIPLSVISTDYHNFAVVYGCKDNSLIGVKYLSAWILSRNKTMASDILDKAHQLLSSIPYANAAYLETVPQDEEQCHYKWTADIQAEELIEAIEKRYK